MNNNVWRILGGIIFVILFFWTPLINISLWILLLIIGGVSFISVHLREQRNYSGKWVIKWDIFLQHMLVGGVVLSCFTMYIFRDLKLLPIILAGSLLAVALYAGLMAIKKENTPECEQFDPGKHQGGS
ncbi:hypothetical protein ASZ90_019855 [hydrocarbon metagenome]|uniref:Uncharacterized protein n=1 Tax=hydrocarbon metagenome TaxID=938273 RepID=A0A0W8E2F4_9ZZZZ